MSSQFQKVFVSGCAFDPRMPEASLRILKNQIIGILTPRQ